MGRCRESLLSAIDQLEALQTLLQSVAGMSHRSGCNSTMARQYGCCCTIPQNSGADADRPGKDL